MTPSSKRRRTLRNRKKLAPLVLKRKLTQVAAAHRYHLTRQRVSQIVKAARKRIAARAASMARRIRGRQA